MNYAEIQSRKGLYGWAPKLPYVLGMECYGEIVAIGSKCINRKIGENVVIGTQFGTYAEYIVVDEIQALPAIKDFSSEQNAAFAVNYMTAWVSLVNIARIKSSDSVLIQVAAGGVGTAAVQIAKAYGCRVFGTTSCDKKIKLLGTWTKIVDSNKNFIKSLRFPTKRKNIIKAMCFYNPFIHSSVLFEKKIIMKLGGYPNDYVHASDYLLWCKIIRNYNVENIDEELTIIRYHSDRSTLRPDKISYVKNESNKIHIYALKNNELKLYLYIFGYFITFFRRFRFFSFIIEKIINLSLSFRRN